MFVFHRVRFTDLGPQKQESPQKQSFGENLSMRSSADATEERARTRTDGEEPRLAQFKEGWEQMCCSCANQEQMCAHVGLYAESLIRLLGNPELEGLKHIAPKLEEIVRLQMDVMRSIEKSSSIITEINGIVSGEAGERNPAVQTTVNRKRRGRSPAVERTTTTPKSARRGRGRGNGDHGAVKRRGAKNKNQTTYEKGRTLGSGSPFFCLARTHCDGSRLSQQRRNANILLCAKCSSNAPQQIELNMRAAIAPQQAPTG